MPVTSASSAFSNARIPARLCASVSRASRICERSHGERQRSDRDRAPVSLENGVCWHVQGWQDPRLLSLGAADRLPGARNCLWLDHLFFQNHRRPGRLPQAVTCYSPVSPAINKPHNTSLIIIDNPNYKIFYELGEKCLLLLAS